MNDSTAISTQAPSTNRWLLLIHQIPPKPDYFRIKVRRRLQQVGAVALKNSVYVLPAGDETVEDFQWLLREIVDGGGEATLCEAGLIDGVSDTELRGTFNTERNADYAEILEAAKALTDSTTELNRVKRRLAEITAVDFFGAPGRGPAERALAAAEERMSAASSPTGAATGPAMTGRTWVTRQDIHVDRMASSWLIRRFIDRNAKFKFVPAKGYQPAAGELRFDMYNGEYTHEGEDCTFETLLARFGVKDRALRAIGDIVHDIDCKDGKFGREEAAGIATIVSGIARSCEEDLGRIERATALFDDLYAHFDKRRG